MLRTRSFLKTFVPSTDLATKKVEKNKCTVDFYKFTPPDCLFIASKKIDLPLDSVERLVEFPRLKNKRSDEKPDLKPHHEGGKIFAVLEFCQGWGRRGIH